MTKGPNTAAKLGISSEARFTELVYQLLTSIFQKVETKREFNTQEIPSFLIDFVAHSKNNRMIFFETRFSKNSSLDYLVYPPLAALKEVIDEQLGYNPPPVLVVITNVTVDSDLQSSFSSLNIPIITFSPDKSITESRLLSSFQKVGLDTPELEGKKFHTTIQPDLESEYQPAHETKSWNLKYYINLNTFLGVGITVLIALGIINLIFRNELWLVETLALVLVVLGWLYINFRDKKRQKRYVNSSIIIISDDRTLTVKKNKWLLERKVVLKARHRTEHYIFSTNWTGSSKNVQVTCREEDGTIHRRDWVTSKAINAQVWELVFSQPLRKNEIKTITLKYVYPDPQQKASPFFRISYDSVMQCHDLTCRVTLAENIKPKGVYLIEGVGPNNFVLDRKKMDPEPDSNFYVFHEKPTPWSKYAIEWDLNNGADENSD